jgi:hypothetical protein
MDLGRFVAYLETIESLLQVLDKKEDTSDFTVDPSLIDMGLVATMRCVAQTAQEQGKPDSAEFLCDLAEQLEMRLTTK